MVSVDNVKGAVLNIAGSDSNAASKGLLSNSWIYGEHIDQPKDCPDGKTGNTGAPCSCPTKIGVTTMIGSIGASKEAYKIKTEASWNTTPKLENVNFINWKEKSTCGGRQFTLGINTTAADIIPIQEIATCKYTNVAYNALVYISNPPGGWANISDCGNWPCTAPSNVVFNFKDTVFEVPDGVTALPTWWTTGVTTKYSFQIVSNFASAAAFYPNGTFNAAWNAWIVADP